MTLPSTTRTATTDTVRRGDDTFVLRGWPAHAPTDTAIVVHHGLGEHGGRYETFARYLDRFPAHLWTFDARGHGQSTGKKGDAAGIEQFAADFEAVLPEILTRSGATRIALVGHSMGGVITAWYLTTRTPHPAIAAVGLSAPPVKIAKSVSVRMKTLLGRALSRVSPTLTLASGIRAEGISSDPAEVERYRSDPLVHDRLSVRLGLSLLDDPPQIVARASSITLPVLLWHGLADPIVDVAGTRELYDAVGSRDKTLVELPGYRHESHHERADLSSALFDRLANWLEAHGIAGEGRAEGRAQ